jgi:hypothetical protein
MRLSEFHEVASLLIRLRVSLDSPKRVDNNVSKEALLRLCEQCHQLAVQASGIMSGVRVQPSNRAKPVWWRGLVLAIGLLLGQREAHATDQSKLTCEHTRIADLWGLGKYLQLGNGDVIESGNPNESDLLFIGERVSQCATTLVHGSQTIPIVVLAAGPNHHKTAAPVGFAMRVP